MINKYATATLPTPDEALQMALDREQWAKQAIEQDRRGTAWEFELTALLLRYFRDHQ